MILAFFYNKNRDSYEIAQVIKTLEKKWNIFGGLGDVSVFFSHDFSYTHIDFTLCVCECLSCV